MALAGNGNNLKLKTSSKRLISPHLPLVIFRLDPVMFLQIQKGVASLINNLYVNAKMDSNAGNFKWKPKCIRIKCECLTQLVPKKKFQNSCRLIFKIFANASVLPPTTDTFVANTLTATTQCRTRATSYRH